MVVARTREQEIAYQAAIARVVWEERKKAEARNPSNPDGQLYLDLLACIEARKLIEPEQARLLKLYERAENPIEKQARQYQHDLVASQLTRAAEVAERRLERLMQVEICGLQQEELRLCEGSSVHWFRYWAWAVDPREDSPLKVQPFYPFRFQERYLEWLEDVTFVHRSSGMVEKSRDMGATVGFLLWDAKQWLFRPYFSALLASRVEALVDSKKNPNTLFEKIRFQLKRTPSWMLPQGFDLNRDMPYMMIANPANGSTIVGEAPTANIGRQSRFTVVLKDESAFWPYGGYPQDTSLSQTSKSVFDVSSVNGEGNKFAETKKAGRTACFVMDWKDHPQKDDRWFEQLPYGYIGKPMDAQQIAQEICRDYRASQPGPIFPMFAEPWHVITWSEFERVYKCRHIPRNWNLGRAQDVGNSPGHENVTAWAAVPPKSDRLSDSVFFYRTFIPPLDWSIKEIAEGRWESTNKLQADGIWQLESPLKEKDRMVLSLISWEAESELKTYAKCDRYQVGFRRIEKPGPNEGQAQMRFLMTLLPEPHPFVIDPRNGKPLMGRPKFYLIVSDEQGELFVDGENKLTRRPALNEDGQLTARYEVVRYHNPPDQKHKPTGKRKPFKKEDNWIDDARYLCRAWGPTPAEKTKQEKIEESLPEPLRSENLPTPSEAGAMNIEDKGEYIAMLQRRDRLAAKAERELEEKEQPRRTRGYLKRPQ